MKVWIERCKQPGHVISWEGVASLVKATHRNGDRNLIQREIDLASTILRKSILWVFVRYSTV